MSYVYAPTVGPTAPLIPGPLNRAADSGGVVGVNDSGSRRLALYNGLNDLLGPELTDTLMTYLPASPATDLATKADVTDLREAIDRLVTEMDRSRADVKHLSQRMDELQTTLLGGFAAMIAALLAAGFLG